MVRRLIGLSLLAGCFASASLGVRAGSMGPFGVNYNWDSEHSNVCPITETLTAFMPNYPTHRSTVQSQLAQMKANGIGSIRAFVEWGDDSAGAQRGDFPGALILPPTTTVPVQFIQNVKLFVQDVAAAGIKNVTLSLGGAGSYRADICGNDVDGLVIPTEISGLDQLLNLVVVPTYTPKPVIQIDLGNEIAPSDYEAACTFDQRVDFIRQIWTHYTSTSYGAQGAGATFSSLLDDSTDFHIAANRLENLIEAIGQTSRPQPTWFEVHTYGSRSAVVNMLRGNYQIYSDHGFLSNQAHPKKTVIGEMFYQDTDTAMGIKDYKTIYDGYNGGYIGLAPVIEWPLQQPVIGCIHAVNVPPPYTATVYSNILACVPPPCDN